MRGPPTSPLLLPEQLGFRPQSLRPQTLTEELSFARKERISLSFRTLSTSLSSLLSRTPKARRARRMRDSPLCLWHKNPRFFLHKKKERSKLTRTHTSVEDHTRTPYPIYEGGLWEHERGVVVRCNVRIRLQPDKSQPQGDVFP